MELSGAAVRPTSRPRAPLPLVSPLAFAPELLADLRRRAEAAYPSECCGALLGGGPWVVGRGSWDGGDESGGAGVIRIVRVVACENAAPDPTRRYSIAPEELLALHRAAREEGLEVVGYYHSHPSGDGEPSAVDRAESWPDLVYVIIPVGPEGAGPVRCWRFAGDAPSEEEILVTRPAGRTPGGRDSP